MKSSPGGSRNRRYEFWRWRIFAITWLAYAGFYLTRRSFDIAKIGMQKDPGILLTRSQMSALDSIYLTAYAVGQFIAGVAGDRFGTRKVILAGMICSIAVGIWMGLSSMLVTFGVLMCLQGLFQATGWSPLAKNIGCWFSRQERGRVMGWWCTQYAVGSAVALLFAGYMAECFSSWRFAFYGPAAGLLIIWMLFLLLQRDRPEDVGLVPIEEYHGEHQAVLGADEPDRSFKTTLHVLKNPMVLVLCGVYFFLKPIRYAIFRWIPLYVNETFGTDLGETALISVCFEIAGPLGILAAGYISDKWFQSRRMPVAVIFLLGLGLILFLFSHLAAFKSKAMVAGLLFAIGFLLYGPDSLVSGTAAIDFGTKKGASTAAGFINGSGSIGAILGGSLPGVIAERWGWSVLFTGLGVSVCLAAILLIPKWNAIPGTGKS